MSGRGLRFALICEIEGTIDIEGYKTVVRTKISAACAKKQIEMVCLAGGAWMRSPYNLEEPSRNIIYRLIEENSLDGIILVSTVTSAATKDENEEFYQLMKGIPIVIIGLNQQGIPNVSNNNTLGIYQLVDHLVEVHHHRSFAFITGPVGNRDSDQRLNAFKSRLKHHNLSLNEQFIKIGDFIPPSGIKAVSAMVKEGTLPDAIIAANDKMAMGAIRELQRNKIRVPDDVAVVGFDNLQGADTTNPPLTTTEQPIGNIAEKAVAMLEELARHGTLSETQETFAPILKIRNSCGCDSAELSQNAEENKVIEQCSDPIAFFDEVIVRHSQTDTVDFEKMRQALQKFIKDQTTENQNALFKTFQGILSPGSQFNFVYDDWVRFVYGLSQLMEGERRKQDSKISENRFFNEVFLLLSHRRRLIEASRQLGEKYRMELMSNFSHSLFRSHSLQDVYDHLEAFFKDNQFKYCQLYLFPSAFTGDSTEFPDDLTEEAYCVFSLKDGSREVVEPVTTKTKELLQHISIPLSSVGSVVVEPLFFGEKKIGILVVQQVYEECFFYESLRGAISSTLLELHTRIERDTANERLQTALKDLKNAHDLLEKKVAERTADLEQAKDEAEKANELKSEFLANISHELRTPMHGILSYSRFGIDKLDNISEEKKRHYFTQIHTSGNRLMSLLNDLLDLSSIEAGKELYAFERIDIWKIVEETIQDFKESLDLYNLKVNLENATKGTEVICDMGKIRQVIRNLLSNAIKFAATSGEITFSSQMDYLLISKDNLNSKKIPAIRLSLKDKGVGIPEEELESIFDKFIQSSKTRTGAGGTGLGLSICLGIIKAHNGKIWAENNPEGGSTFHFVLPAYINQQS